MSTQGQGYVTMKAEIRRLHLGAKARRRWPANHWELQQTWYQCSVVDLGRRHPC